jgi:hypothetical protein
VQLLFFWGGGWGLEFKILLQGFMFGGSNMTLKQSSHASSEFFFLSICLDDDEDFDATFCTSDVVCFLHSFPLSSINRWICSETLELKKTKVLLGSCK